MLSEMDLLAIIRGRRSVRCYAQRPVEATLLEELLEAARWSPSPHNAQPWRFVVISKREQRLRLARAMAAEWQRDMERDGLLEKVIEFRMAASCRRLEEAPVLILVCLSSENLDVYPDAARQEAEMMMAVQSIGAAIQNMLLMAHQRGLAACWLCAPLFCPDVIRRVLDIPNDLRPQALLTLGYAAESPQAPERCPLHSLVYYR
ncbi:MAG: nitroreductase family protein [Chloroflexi bacterium]|nr:nitroreductase family protein [Chloroflexota bacterium]MCL5074397.1 nitroreductase family protein [Chloroflexota bacterium]